MGFVWAIVVRDVCALMSLSAAGGHVIRKLTGGFELGHQRSVRNAACYSLVSGRDGAWTAFHCARLGSSDRACGRYRCWDWHRPWRDTGNDYAPHCRCGGMSADRLFARTWRLSACRCGSREPAALGTIRGLLVCKAHCQLNWPGLALAKSTPLT